MRFVFRTLIASLMLVTFACSAENSTAKTDFKEGLQYKKVREVQKPTDPKRILVEEAFWYGCQHCFHFDPYIEAWKKTKPADVDFVRLPSSLGRAEGIIHQKAYYTAQVLNVGDKIHKPLFDGIHEKHQPLFTQDAIRLLFNQETGIMPDVFDATFTGFAVDSQVRRADTLLREYAISSVPAVVVGGKYTTSAAMADGFDGMIDVVNFLIEKVRQERK
jgi:thiol:disulfide interchange protein DsbA